MDKKNIATLVGIAFIAIIIASIFSGVVFSSSKHRNLKAPVVQAIDSSFPDIKNDPTYNTVFNSKALDPTQLIKIGTSQNETPFNATQ